jgi:hypothetical protein
VTQFGDAKGRLAGRVVTSIELDEADRIVAIHTVLATRKLSAVRAL